MRRSRVVWRVIRTGLCAGIAGAALSQPALALSVGQLDDFEDGTTQGWAIGIPLPGVAPQHVADGGPGGAGDAYLLLTSVGAISNPGGRLVAFNRDQWAGDYTAADVTGIRLSANNLGTSDLSLRLYLADSASAPQNSAISSAASFLPSGSGWVQLFFPLEPGDLTAVTGSVAAALANAAELRILHASGAVFPGDPLAAQLGVDAVQAVPEPGSAALLAWGLAGLARGRGRGRVRA